MSRTLGSRVGGEGSNPGTGRQCRSWASAGFSTAQRTIAMPAARRRGTPGGRSRTASPIAWSSAARPRANSTSYSACRDGKYL